MIAPPNPLTASDAAPSALAADPSAGRDTAFQDMLGQKIGAIATAHDATRPGKIRASDRQDPRTIASTGLDMVHNPTAMALADLSSAAPVKATVASAEQQQTTPTEPAATPDPRGKGTGSTWQSDERSSEGPKPATAAPVDRPSPSTATAVLPDQSSTAHAATALSRTSTASSKSSTASATATPVQAAARSSAPAAPGALQAIGKVGAAAAPRPQSGNAPNVPAAIKAAAALDKAARALGKQPTAAARLAPNEEKIAAQAARGLAAALRQGGGSVTLRLQPDALGELKVKLDLTGTKVAASFEVGSDQARKLLDTTLTTLRSALEARGLQVDRLEIRVTDRPGHAPQTQDAGHPFGGADHGGAGGGDRGMPERDAPGHGAGFIGMGRIPPAAPTETGQAHGARPGPEPTVIQTGGVPLMRVRLDAVA
jgi:flagellar hook-length control protein FliK